MKKSMVYVIALTLAFSTFLAGCGEMNGTNGVTKPTEKPLETILPETMMPKPEDGVVNDTDGIITDSDNGTVTETSPKMPSSTLNPGNGAPASGAAGMTNAAKR